LARFCGLAEVVALQSLQRRTACITRVVIVRSRARNPAVEKLARALCREGHNVTLLRWNRSGDPDRNVQSEYGVAEFRLQAPYDQPAAFFFIPFWQIFEFFYLLTHDNEIIHACDLDTLVPAILAKVIKGVKLCYTIFDVYADNLPSKTPKMLRRLVRSFERRGTEFADYLFVVNEFQLEQLSLQRTQRLECLYNAPEDVDSSNPHRDVPGRLTLFYGGLLLRTRGLEGIIDVVTESAGLRLVVAGSGPDASFFTRLTVSSRDKVELIGWVPNAEVIKKTQEADAVIALYDPAVRSNTYASPNKLFEAMMCRRPIITNVETVAGKIVQEEGCGITVPYGDREALRSALELLRDDVELREELAERGRRAYDLRYSWKLMTERLFRAYESLENL